MVRIPSEYQEVEYLESTGEQFIVTNVIPTIDLAFHCRFSVTSNVAPGYGNVFGARSESNSREYQLSGYGGGIIGVGKRNSLNNMLTSKNIHVVGFDGHDIVNVDGIDITISNFDEDLRLNSYPVNLFAIQQGVSRIGFQRQAGKIYELSFVGKANFIPCYRKSDNEPGMYDTVSKTFFTNSGTGTFLVGNDVNYSNTNLLEVRRRILLNTPHLESMSGNPAIFTTDIAANLKECKIRFSPVQAGEGTPSPENVRPISGWDGVSLEIQKGKNYLPSIDMVVWRIGYFNNSGKAINSDAYYRTNPILVPAGDYTLSTKYGRWKGIFAKDQNDATVAFTERNANAITVTLPTSAYIQVYVDSSSEEVQLENNSIATDYEPSKNTSFLIKDVSLNTKNILPPFNLTFWYGGYFNSSGEKRSSGAYVNSTPIKVSAGSYTLSSENTAWKGVYAEDLEGNKTVFKELLGKTLTVDIPVDGYIRVYLESIQNAQLEYGTEATPYEPYVEPQTISIPFPQTIFGGYVDLIKGEIVEEYQKAIVNDETNLSSWNSNNDVATHRYVRVKNTGTDPTTAYGLSNMFVLSHGNIWNHPKASDMWTFTTNTINLHLVFDNDAIGINPGTSDADRTTAIKTWLADKQIVFAIPLRIPNVYPLIPQSIKALKGLNNLYSDANGNVEVKFWKH